MNRKYPHKSKGGPRSDPRSWMCRCGAEPTFLSQVHAGEWGACALALEEALADAEARAERAEAERDAARKMLAECYRLSDGDTWEHLWQTAVDEVRELRQQYDEMRRESRADTDKAVAAALEARAKEIDAKAEAAREAGDKEETVGDYQQANAYAGRWAAFQAAARIVRGT